MRHNPAASYDLGSYMASVGCTTDDIGYYALSTTTVPDPDTVQYGSDRFNAAYDAWLEAHVA